MREMSSPTDYVGMDEVNAPNYRRGERPSMEYCPECDRKLVRMVPDGVWYCKACAREFSSLHQRKAGGDALS